MQDRPVRAALASRLARFHPSAPGDENASTQRRHHPSSALTFKRSTAHAGQLGTQARTRARERACCGQDSAARRPRVARTRVCMCTQKGAAARPPPARASAHARLRIHRHDDSNNNCRLKRRPARCRPAASCGAVAATARGDTGDTRPRKRRPTEAGRDAATTRVRPGDQADAASVTDAALSRARRRARTPPARRARGSPRGRAGARARQVRARRRAHLLQTMTLGNVAGRGASVRVQARGCRGRRGRRAPWSRSA